MSDERVIELTSAQIDRTWMLTYSLVANEGAAKRSLDVLFVMAARFVERVDAGLAADGAVFDSGKAGPPGKLTFLVRRKA